MSSDDATSSSTTQVPPKAKLSSGLPRPIVPVGSPAGPKHPFPLKMEGPVIKGFGRGSKELNIPTANIPVTGMSLGGREDVESGVYFGWAGLDLKGNEVGPNFLSCFFFLSLSWPIITRNTQSMRGSCARKQW